MTVVARSNHARWKWLAAAVALAAIAPGGLSAPARADTAPPAGVPETTTADAQPTWQTDGIVWKMATAGDAGQYVFAAGNFTHLRPPGVAPGGTGEVARTNLAAFNTATGTPTPFSYAITGTPFTSATNPGPGYCDDLGDSRYVCDSVMRVQASPAKDKIYFGGDFTSVGGQARTKFAAVDVRTGAIDPNLKPVINSRVRAIAVTASTVFIGGDFTTVNGQPRARLAAFDRATGALLPWAPNADRTVYALAASNDGSRIVIGGVYDHIGSAAVNGISAVSASTGGLLPWADNPIPKRNGTVYSAVTDLVVSGSTLYGGAEGNGVGVFDGRFSFDITTGKLKWLDKCLGATQSVALVRDVLYSASHAHDCSDINGFPETPVNRRYQRLLAETADSGGKPKPTLLHWYPLANTGPANSYFKNGPWATAGTSDHLWIGGEFTTINGVAQQGLTRFTFKSVAADVGGPEAPFAAPTVRALPGGTVQVRTPATWDRDNQTLTYDVFREDSATPVGSVSAGSTFWNLPPVSYVDANAKAGSHTYRVRARDPYNNARNSPNAAAVSVSEPAGPYASTVVGDRPTDYWRLNEPSGSVMGDSMGYVDGTYGSSVYRNVPGALANYPGTAILANGTANGIAASRTVLPAPSTYSVEFWVKTNTKAGGKIMGLGNKTTGLSDTSDRHVYMDNAGHLLFGVWVGGAKTIASPTAYNDNAWHHVVATQGSSGRVLYVDGRAVASDGITTAAAYSGVWRLGGDNVNYWPSKPSTPWFYGGIDEAAVYPTALTAQQVADHWAAGR